MLIATGRKPNTESLNLHAAGVEVGSRGEIVIDDYLKTTNSRIYSAGDVTPGPQFVYVAAYEGGLAARNAIGGLNQKGQFRSGSRRYVYFSIDCNGWFNGATGKRKKDMK